MISKNYMKFVPYLLIGILAVVVYSKTISFDYAWDDQLVITENDVTQKGVTGLKEIWTSASYINERPIYRPIPQSIFALQWTISKNNPSIGHGTNIFLYALTCMLLLYFLRLVFPKINRWLLWWIALFFVLLPVHVEVVANIKSLDELLASFFSVVALIFIVHWSNTTKFEFLLGFLFFLGAAILSKIGSVSLVPLASLCVYVKTNNTTQFKNDVRENLWNLIQLEQLHFKQLVYMLSLLVFIAIVYFSNSVILLAILSILLVGIINYKVSDSAIYYHIVLLLILSHVSQLPILLGIALGYTIIHITKSKDKYKWFWLVSIAVIICIPMALKKDLIGVFINLALFGSTIWAYLKNKKLVFLVLLVVGIISLLEDLNGFALVCSQLIILQRLYNFKFKQYVKPILLAIAFLIIGLQVFQKNTYTLSRTAEQNIVQHFQNRQPVDTDSFYQIHNVLAGKNNITERIPTASVISLKYLQLLFYPNKLIHQYGYNQIPLADFYHWKVWLSIFIHLILLALAIFGLYHKKWYAFGILWYLITISIYSNIVLLMPDTLAERFLYLPSIGFCIAIVFGLHEITNRLAPNNPITITGILLLPLAVFFGYKTLERIPAWENNYTLAAMTVPNAPNNAAINAQYAAELVLLQENNPNEDLSESIIYHFSKAVEIMPNFYSANTDLGRFYIDQGEPALAKPYLEKAATLRPNSWINNYYLGFIEYDAKQYLAAINRFKTALSVPNSSITDEEFILGSEFLARCYFNTQEISTAAIGLEKTYALYGSKSSLILLANMYRESGLIPDAINTFQRLKQDYPTDLELEASIQILQQSL